jgi:hypothetical protein
VCGHHFIIKNSKLRDLLTQLKIVKKSGSLPEADFVNDEYVAVVSHF